MPVPTVFISYSHQDEFWKNKLLPQLRALEQAGIGMRVWHDRKIDGGDQWYPEIQDAMANAAVALLLISPDFLASGFITKEEVPYLIERQEKHGKTHSRLRLPPPRRGTRRRQSRDSFGLTSHTLIRAIFGSYCQRDSTYSMIRRDPVAHQCDPNEVVRSRSPFGCPPFHEFT